MALASYGGTQERARDSRRKQELDSIKKALELAKQDTPGAYYYPSCVTYDASGGCALTDTATNPSLTSGSTPYMNSVPLDPQTPVGYHYTPTPANCTGPPTPTCTSYKLIACLENTKDTQKDADQTGLNETLCPGTTLVSYTARPN